MTTPHAADAGPEGLSTRNSSAGTASPATAATIGTAAREVSRSSPIANSRLTSRPTTKKNNAIRPSFTQCWRSSSMPWVPTVIDSGVCQNA